MLSLCLQYHAETIQFIREAAESFQPGTVDYRPVAIAMDTKGPCVRTGLIKGVSAPSVCLSDHPFFFYPYHTTPHYVSLLTLLCVAATVIICVTLAH